MSFIDNFVRLSNNESFSGGSSYFTANNIDVASRNIGQGVRIMAQATIITQQIFSGATFTVSIIGSYYPIDRNTSIPSYPLTTNAVASSTVSYSPSASLIQIPNGTRVRPAVAFGSGLTNNYDYFVRNSTNGSFQLATSPTGPAVTGITIDQETIAPQFEYLGSSGARANPQTVGVAKSRIAVTCNSTAIQAAPINYRYLAVQLSSSISLAFTATVDIIIGHQEGFRNYKSGFEIA
jgi:hypothetical protein